MPVTPTKSKSKGARFVRFYPSDWRSGCLGLSLEQEGLYIRICAFIYETSRRLPLDDSAASKFLGAHTNAYRKIRDQLADLGKLSRCDDGWTVNRAERELAAAIGAGPSADQERAFERQAHQDEGRVSSQNTVVDTPHNTHIDTPHVTGGVFSENPNEINGRLLEPIANSQEPIKTPVAPTDLRRLFQPADENLGVIVSEGGTIKLNGDLLAFWLDQFGGSQQRLDLALRGVSIQPNSRTPIRAQVERQLSFRAADKLDRDQRYQAAAAANKPEKKPFRPSRWQLG